MRLLLQKLIVSKDENMHPTFKTTWPFIMDWFFDVAIEADDNDFDDLEIEDKEFIAMVAAKRGRRNFWLNVINKIFN